MDKALKSATPRARGRGGKEKAISFTGQIYDTIKSPRTQALSSLLDLALVEFDQAAEKAKYHRRRAELWERRALRKLVTLRSLQENIPPTGGAAQ